MSQFWGPEIQDQYHWIEIKPCSLKRLQGRICSLPQLASHGCRHSLACGCITPISVTLRALLCVTALCLSCRRTLALGPTWIIQKKLLNLIDLSRIPKDPFPYKVTHIPGIRPEVLEAIIQPITGSNTSKTFQYLSQGTVLMQDLNFTSYILLSSRKFQGNNISFMSFS